MKVADLFVELRVEDGGSAAKIEKVGKAAEGTKVSSIALGGVLADLGRRLIDVGLQAARAAVSFAVDMVTGTAELGDEIAKTSKGIGVASDQLQRLRFAAERSGGSADGMTKAIKLLTVGLEDAAEKGTGPVAEGLEAIGLSAKDLQGLGIEEQFSVISEALKGVDDEARKSAISMKLFGARGGSALKPLLDEGAAGIRALGDEAERLGGILGEDALKDSEEFQDSILDMKLAFAGIVRSIGSDLIPMFRGMIETVKEWTIENRELIQTKVRAFVEALIEAGRKLIPMLVDLVKIMGDVLEVVSGASGLTFAFAALAVVVGGIPGVVILAGVALGTFLADTLAGLTGLNDEIAETKRITEGTKEIKRLTKQSEDAQAATVEIFSGTEGISDKKFEDLKEKARVGTKGDNRAKVEGFIAAEEAKREVRSELAGIERTTAFIQGQGVKNAGAQKKRRAAGGGKAKPAAKVEPITGIPEIDAVLRREEEAGEINLSAAGGGAAPGVATTINRVDQSFNAPTTITVEIPADSLPEGDADAMGTQIGEAIARALDDRNRTAADHFQSVVTV